MSVDGVPQQVNLIQQQLEAALAEKNNEANEINPFENNTSVFEKENFDTFAQDFFSNPENTAASENTASLFANNFLNHIGITSDNKDFNILSQTLNSVLDEMSNIDGNDGLSKDDFNEGFYTNWYNNKISQENTSEPSIPEPSISESDIVEDLIISPNQETINSEDTVSYDEISNIVGNTEQIIYDLCDKYNLDIDIKNITDEEADMLQKLQYIDSMPSVLSEMKEYETTLGWIDNTYDGLKDIFGDKLTRNDVEQFAKNDALKREVLTSSIINGSVTIADETSGTTISRDDYLNLAQETMSCLNPDDIVDYAIKNLGYSEDEAMGIIKKQFIESVVLGSRYSDFEEIPQDLIEQINNEVSFEKNENGKYVIVSDNKIVEDYSGMTLDEACEIYQESDLTLTESAIPKFINNAKINEGNKLSFDQLYSTFTSVEYNEQALGELNSMKPAYDAIVNINQNALLVQDALSDLNSPDEALRYFEQMASEKNDGTAGVELFNQYYEKIFEYADNNGDLFSHIGDIKNGLRVDSIKADEEGNITTTYKIDLNNEFSKQFIEQIADDDRYSFDEKTGLVTLKYNPEESEIPFNDRVFNELNQTIADNNIYLKQEKDRFNEQFKELLPTEDGSIYDVYSEVMLSYADKYSEAMGVNAFETKLAEYIEDMDTYAQKFGQTLSTAGFALSWVPGLQAFGMLALVGSYSDNAIDAVNILTSHDKDKENKLLSLAASTTGEMVQTAAGMGIGKAAGFIGANAAGLYVNHAKNATGNGARFISTAVEYGADVLMSMGWDCINYTIQKGQKPDSKAFIQIATQNLKSNLADLKGGIGLYRAMQNPNEVIDLGFNRTLQFDSENNVVYTAQNGDYIRYASADGKNELDLNFDADGIKGSYDNGLSAPKKYDSTPQINQEITSSGTYISLNSKLELGRYSVLDLNNPEYRRIIMQMKDKDSIIVGRGENCDIVINDRNVSREHLILTRVGNQLLVRDNNSTNGTKYKGGSDYKKLDANIYQEVSNGTHVYIGETDLNLDNLNLKTGQTITIGRQSAGKAGYVIDDNRISAKHLKVTKTDNGYIVADLGSTNGTIIKSASQIEQRKPTGPTNFEPAKLRHRDGSISVYNNISNQKYHELFPTVDGYVVANSAQKSNGDCYLVSAINALFSHTKAKDTIINCFTEMPDGSIKVKLPNGTMEFDYNKIMREVNKNPDMYSQTSPGIQALEYAYQMERYQKAVEIEAGKINLHSANDDFTDNVYSKLKSYHKKGRLISDINPIEFREGGLTGEVMSMFGFKTTDYYSADNPIDMVNIIKNTIDSGDYVYTISTNETPEGGGHNRKWSKELDIAGSHSYLAIPKKRKNGQIEVEIRNPWHSTEISCILTLDEIKKHTDWFKAVRVTKVN